MLHVWRYSVSEKEDGARVEAGNHMGAGSSTGKDWASQGSEDIAVTTMSETVCVPQGELTSIG